MLLVFLLLLFSIKIPDMDALLSTTTTSALIGAAVAVANEINDMKNVDQELKKLKVELTILSTLLKGLQSMFGKCRNSLLTRSYSSTPGAQKNGIGVVGRIIGRIEKEDGEEAHTSKVFLDMDQS